MKFLNNYLFFTDASVQELIEFNECRIKFKYGKGSSCKDYVNNRTEKRLNLNKPHPGYENTYFCENQKNYSELEDYTLQKLRENNDFKCIKTNSITNNNSEFFWIREKVINMNELKKQWYNLKKLINEIHYNFYTNTEEVEKILSIQEEEKEDFENTDMDINKEEDKIIDYKDFDKNIMSLKGSKLIYYKLDNEKYENISYNKALKKIFIKYKNKYNIENYSMIKSLTQEELNNITNNTFNYIYDDKYYRLKDSYTVLRTINKLQQECNINLELKIKLA